MFSLKPRRKGPRIVKSRQHSLCLHNTTFNPVLLLLIPSPNYLDVCSKAPVGVHGYFTYIYVQQIVNLTFTTTAYSKERIPRNLSLGYFDSWSVQMMRTVVIIVVMISDCCLEAFQWLHITQRMLQIQLADPIPYILRLNYDTFVASSDRKIDVALNSKAQH